MVKPVDSKSVHRPLRKDSEGTEVRLTGKIIMAGHVSSVVQIGPIQVRIGNSALREAADKPDL